MFGPVGLTVLGALVAITVNLFISFTRNLAAAKKTGLRCIPAPYHSIGITWSLINALVTPILRQIPFTNSSKWMNLNSREDTFHSERAAEKEYGDVYIQVTPQLNVMKISNAELAYQIASRKTDFLKPVAEYKIIDMFGKNLVTLEGQDWKRHKKIVGPSFSEKSNKLVFEESLRQAEGMLGLWSSQGNNTQEDISVQNIHSDTAILSMHVICMAGFGVGQLWPGESPKRLGDKAMPGLSTNDVQGTGHTMIFKESLHELLQGLIWLVLLPPWLLRKSPFETHNAVYRAFDECKRYFEELFETKRKELYQGEHDEGTMDLMGPMVRASEASPDNGSKSQIPHTPILSKEEIIGNSFIFLFAGHETSANSIHYSILYLAMNRPSQKHMQSDIDNIVGKRPTASFSYNLDMPRLYNSMVGAVMNEQLRLMPAILGVPKVTNGDQVVTMDGREFVIKDRTHIQINVTGTNRNPRYWPSSPSKITPGTDDLNDFVPERWLNSKSDGKVDKPVVADEGEGEDGLEQVSFETNGSLFKPIKGSFTTFSEGMRACPGRRFAQVEITAVLTMIFQKYSVELDVAEWASDVELVMMGKEEKRALYEKAKAKARAIMARARQETITLQFVKGDYVPVRFVLRGKERFGDIY